MKTIQIDIYKLLFTIFIWGSVFFGFSLANFNRFESLNIIGFSFLAFIPGFLTLVGLRLGKFDGFGSFAVCVGFSLLELMLIGLIGNFTLPFFGVARPLDKLPLLVEIGFLVLVLAIICSLRVKKIKINVGRYLFFDEFIDFVFAFTPLFFVVLAVLGAIRLNNGASSVLTLIMLVALAIYAVFLMAYAKKVGANVIPVALFFMALAILLMTSMRGWYVTGHDIQREYRFFEISKNAGLWSIAANRDAYNACLSITILPTFFGNLLKFFDPYVYKIFFQVIFSIVPGLIFLIARRYVAPVVALISTFYFIAFPNFFSDMPFLNRQEIALLYFTLMIYVIFAKNISSGIKKTLFLSFGVGMIISHYSTAYTALAIFIFSTVAYPVVLWIARRARIKRIFRNSAVAGVNSGTAPRVKLITLWMVIVLSVGMFLWASLITKTASTSIYRVIIETIENMKNGIIEDAQSNDVKLGLFFSKTLSPAAALEEYQKNIVAPQRAAAPAGTYYDTGSYDQYQIKPAYDEILPSTSVGMILAQDGINPTDINKWFRAVFAAILQIFVVIGFLFTMFGVRFVKKRFDIEFYLLAGGSLFLLALFVFLSTFSIEYSVFRLFQQSLVFLGIFAVIGSLAIAAPLKKAGTFFAGTLAVIFFLFESGVITQILGGYEPQLNLNNDGLYYDICYVHESEISGIDWLAALPIKKWAYQSETQSSRYSDSLGSIIPSGDIYPGLIRRDSYVVLGFANINKQQSTLSYKGDFLTYTYPVLFLDNNKNLIYNDGGLRIYK